MDKLVDIRVAVAAGFFAPDVLPGAIKRTETQAGDDIVLRPIEHPAENKILAELVRVADDAQCVCGVVEQQLGRSVYGNHEEEFLKVNC